MTLESLKEDYKRTFTDPRLSGKTIPEEYWRKMSAQIDAAATLEEFVAAIESKGSSLMPVHKPDDHGHGHFPNTERFILGRILAWNDELPVEFVNGAWKKIMPVYEESEGTCTCEQTKETEDVCPYSVKSGVPDKCNCCSYCRKQCSKD